MLFSGIQCKTLRQLTALSFSACALRKSRRVCGQDVIGVEDDTYLRVNGFVSGTKLGVKCLSLMEIIPGFMTAGFQHVCMQCIDLAMCETLYLHE